MSFTTLWDLFLDPKMTPFIGYMLVMYSLVGLIISVVCFYYADHKTKH